MAQVGTVKHLAISVSASGDNSIVGGLATKHIRVINYCIQAAAPVNVQWKSGASGFLSGLFVLGANTIMEASSPKDVGLMTTGANQSLILNLSGAIQISGYVTYIEEGL